MRWWNEMSKETKTRLYIGMPIYRIKEEGVWANDEELINQLKLNNTYDHVSGFVMFTYRNFREAKSELMERVHKKLLNVWNK